MRGDDPIGRLASRRKFLLSGGALGVATLAGCTDSSGDEEGGEPGDEMLSEEFDLTDPDWENNNYLGGLIPENDYIRGTEQDLEDMAASSSGRCSSS